MERVSAALSLSLSLAVKHQILVPNTVSAALQCALEKFLAYALLQRPTHNALQIIICMMSLKSCY